MKVENKQKKKKKKKKKNIQKDKRKKESCGKFNQRKKCVKNSLITYKVTITRPCSKK